MERFKGQHCEGCKNEKNDFRRRLILMTRNILCKVAEYEKEQANIYLLTGKTELPEFSLDAIYECVLDEEEQETACAGVIRERYWSNAWKSSRFSY